MKKLLAVVLILFLSFSSVKKDHNIFNSNGISIEYKNMIDSLETADVVLFGEIHNNTVCHWLELQVLKDLSDKKKLVAGAEFFETDNQVIIDEYFQALFRTSHFENEMKLWDNYSTDYKPLVEYCRENNIQFVATNIPRRYASIVGAKGVKGLQEISEEGRKFIPPLELMNDIPEGKIYNDLKNAGGHNMGIPYIMEAQAIKDAAMAFNINRSWRKNHVFFHVNGKAHSDYHESIAGFLKKINPALKIMTISITEQDKIEKLDKESKQLGDFIIVTSADVPKSY